MHQKKKNILTIITACITGILLFFYYYADSHHSSIETDSSGNIKVVFKKGQGLFERVVKEKNYHTKNVVNFNPGEVKSYDEIKMEYDELNKSVIEMNEEMRLDIEKWENSFFY